MFLQQYQNYQIIQLTIFIQNINSKFSRMLIKDPYLLSDIKNRSYSAIQSKNVGQFPHFEKQYKQKEQYISQPYQQKGQYTSQPYKRPTQDLQTKNKIQLYEREMRSISEAYRNQEQVLKKISSYQSVNQEYHEAMKQRNYELNTKVNDLSYERSLLARKHEEQLIRNTFDKGNILKKYQEQNQEILKLKRTVTDLIQHKARLQSQIDHLMFSIEKQNHQGSLQIKEQLIRMENMEKTLRGIIDTKDLQITQLRHRVMVYEDENRRLNDMNKTLTIVRQQKIDNLSKIEHLDSNVKSHNKQNIDINRRDDRKDDFLISELKQQKQINNQLISEINMMKKKLFQEPKHTFDKQKQIQNSNFSQQNARKTIQTLKSLRNKIFIKIYDVYCQSVKQGEKQKKNSLLIFINNCKKAHIQSNLTDINQYMNVRQSLKQTVKQSRDSDLKQRIELQLPMKLNSRKHTKENEWVLSTMQFTKNQRKQLQGNKQSGEQANNSILYLFRLLTIKYRTDNQIEGESYHLQTDVQNQLLHSIVKAFQSLIQIR